MSSAKQDKPDKTASAKVRIDLGHSSYDIHIGKHLLSRVPDFVPLDLEGRKLFVLTDENVAPVHAQAVRDSLQSCKPRAVELMVAPAGEQTKSLAMLQRVLDWMIDGGADRESVLFAVGGGVIGDLGGFAASIVLRGIPFVQVPTTLLAQVDSSVGGKTGINMPQGKNLVGAFYQPLSVICDIATLATLPRREVLAGYAETVKYGLINDPEFFIWLEREGRSVCELEGAAAIKAIETACRKKAEIVSADEREKGVRALLNLGHTFGHALEAAAGFDGRLLHGEAVAIGMVLAFRLSERLALCSDEDGDRVEAHLRKMGLPTRISDLSPWLETSAEDLVGHMQHDKKATRGSLAFIVVNGIGKAHVLRDISREDITAVLEHSISG